MDKINIIWHQMFVPVARNVLCSNLGAENKEGIVEELKSFRERQVI